MVAAKVVFAGGRRLISASRNQAKGLKDKVCSAVHFGSGVRRLNGPSQSSGFMEVIPEVAPDPTRRMFSEDEEDPIEAAQAGDCCRASAKQDARAQNGWHDEATTDTLPNMPLIDDDDDSDCDTASAASSGAPSREASSGAASCEGPPARADSYEPVDHTLDVWEAVEQAVKEASSVAPWGRSYKRVRTLVSAQANYGTVELMECLDKGCMAAVKKMPINWTRSGPEDFDVCWPQATERPWRDWGMVKYLQKQNYPHICQILGTFQDSTHTYFASALANRGDLFNWLSKTGVAPGPKREACMRPVFAQILSAVRHLHDLGVAHRDLSIENIVMNGAKGEVPQVKLIDFGMATLHQKCTEIRGKPPYQAPEMHQAEEHDTFLADAFALGVVGFVLATGDYPWQSTRPGECENFGAASGSGFMSLLVGWKASCGPAVDGECLADSLSQPLQDLLEGLLVLAPSSRLALGEGCWAGACRMMVSEMEWLQK